MDNSVTNVEIRATILFEYCKRSHGQSENPEMHFYVIPELRNTDNDLIKANAIHLIDENLVRGGVDDDGSQTFPWIRKITPTGMDVLERLVLESEVCIPELRGEIEGHAETQDRILGFISYCQKSRCIPVKVLSIAENIII